MSDAGVPLSPIEHIESYRWCNRCYRALVLPFRSRARPAPSEAQVAQIWKAFREAYEITPEQAADSHRTGKREADDINPAPKRRQSDPHDDSTLRNSPRAASAAAAAADVPCGPATISPSLVEAASPSFASSSSSAGAMSALAASPLRSSPPASAPLSAASREAEITRLVAANDQVETALQESKSRLQLLRQEREQLLTQLEKVDRAEKEETTMMQRQTATLSEIAEALDEIRTVTADQFADSRRQLWNNLSEVQQLKSLLKKLEAFKQEKSTVTEKPQQSG